MYKFLLVITIIPCVILFSFLFEEKIMISKRLEIPISIFTPIEIHDHIEGEWAMDGYKYDILKLEKKQTEKIINKIEKNSRWRNDKLNDWLKTKIERYSKEEDTTGIRNVDNGYWYFKNLRSDVAETYNFENYLNKLDNHIPAFIVAMLDTDNNILYFYELIG